MSVSSEKRKEILNLLAGGKISADEAAELLSGGPAVVEPETPTPAPAKPESPEKAAPLGAEPVGNGGRPRWLHVRVSDLSTGKGKVTVNIPIRLLKFGMTVGSRFAPEIEGLNWQELSELIETETGVLVDVQDEEDGEHVQIYVD